MDRHRVAEHPAVDGERDERRHDAHDTQDDPAPRRRPIIVGTPDECRKKVKTYQEMGIDRLMCLHQVGGIRHDKVMRSIRMFSQLIPEFDRG